MIKALAVGLILLGIIGLAWGGISYTRTEKAVDLGPIEINKESHKTIPVPPLLGAAALIGGVALIISSKSK